MRSEISNCFFLQIVYLYWFHRLREFKSKHTRIEIEFAVERAFDVLGLAKPVLLASERKIRNRNPFRTQRLNHSLRLVGRHHFVLESLEEDHRTRQSLREIDRRACNINIPLFRIRPNESIEIPRFKFVRLLSQSFGIADAVMTCAGIERIAKGQRAKRRVTAGASAGDHQAVSIDFALPD